MDFLTNAKLTKTNVNVQYGANKKDLNKRITLSSVVKHQLAWRTSDVTVNAELQHPEMVCTVHCVVGVCLLFWALGQPVDVSLLFVFDSCLIDNRCTSPFPIHMTLCIICLYYT